VFKMLTVIKRDPRKCCRLSFDSSSLAVHTVATTLCRLFGVVFFDCANAGLSLLILVEVNV